MDRTNIVEEMKKQTIGVEVEMNNITRNKAARVAAEYFGTDNHRYIGGSYDTWSAWDAQGREWKFMSDASIEGPTSQRCELVTPILHYDDIPTLQELLRQLRHAGAKSDASRGCGVHIHIGADGHDSKTLRHLANIMASHEDLLTASLHLSRWRLNQYCKPVDPEFIKRLNDSKPQTMDELADIWYDSQDANYGRNYHYNSSRYHMLNYHSVFTKGTVEFRLFQFEKPDSNHRSGIHAGAIKTYIQLCLAMSQFAKTMRSSSPTKVQMDNQKYAMAGWLCKMGLTGEEFKTARIILNKHLNGNTGRRYVA